MEFTDHPALRLRATRSLYNQPAGWYIERDEQISNEEQPQSNVSFKSPTSLSGQNSASSQTVQPNQISSNLAGRYDNSERRDVCQSGRDGAILGTRQCGLSEVDTANSTSNTPALSQNGPTTSLSDDLSDISGGSNFQADRPVDVGDSNEEINSTEVGRTNGARVRMTNGDVEIKLVLENEFLSPYIIRPTFEPCLQDKITSAAEHKEDLNEVFYQFQEINSFSRRRSSRLSSLRRKRFDNGLSVGSNRAGSSAGSSQENQRERRLAIDKDEFLLTPSRSSAEQGPSSLLSSSSSSPSSSLSTSTLSLVIDTVAPSCPSPILRKNELQHTDCFAQPKVRLDGDDSRLAEKPKNSFQKFPFRAIIAGKEAWTTDSTNLPELSPLMVGQKSEQSELSPKTKENRKFLIQNCSQGWSAENGSDADSADRQSLMTHESTKGIFCTSVSNKSEFQLNGLAKPVEGINGNCEAIWIKGKQNEVASETATAGQTCAKSAHQLTSTKMAGMTLKELSLQPKNGVLTAPNGDEINGFSFNGLSDETKVKRSGSSWQAGQLTPETVALATSRDCK
ncbi:unnamed protein product [Protopolystoma xenopodis]|uniref:Uncharacterized protein n=1 Tax=Protopolystoma xenopodis TaxID=117903 RepID=A0A3S5FFW7_9PLAT|nr:unnamed protein product [Protopolystoma xenopodis]